MIGIVACNCPAHRHRGHCKPLDRKWVWSIKNVSKCRFFGPGLYNFLNSVFIFCRKLQNTISHNSPSPQPLDRKWVWSIKNASKCRFFIPVLYNFLNFVFKFCRKLQNTISHNLRTGRHHRHNIWTGSGCGASKK